MTQTETPTVASAGAAAARLGPIGLVGSGDHKVIGRLYIATSLVFMLASLAIVELLAVDRVHTFLSGANTQAWYRALLTSRDLGLAFGGLVPLFIGIGLVVVPLQIGARTVAFPRAAAASYWAYLLGAALTVVSYALKGGPAGTRTKGVELFAAAFILLLLALLLATVCVVTTAVALRPPGMALDRVPLFTWGMVVSGIIWLLTIPVLIAGLLVAYVDHRHSSLWLGNDPFAMYRRMLWAIRQPEVFALAAPALGFASDVVPVVARARYDSKLLEYQGALINIGFFAVLGFGAYTAGTTGAAAHTLVYIVMAFLVMLPPVALLGMWGDLFRRGAKIGRPQLAAPMLYGVAALLLLLAGGAAAATESIKSSGVQNTLFEYGQFNLVILAGLVGALGALHWWSTKVVGRPVSDLVGAGAGLMVAGGAFLLAMGDILSAGFGTAAQAGGAGIRWANWVLVIGGAGALGGTALAVLNLLAGLRPSREGAPADPWHGHTLEWLTPSPPPPENFEDLPLVTSEAPLLDRREATSADRPELEAPADDRTGAPV